MNIELYIGNRLCDIGNPESFGISLKRVFIKPAELSTKDAQKSYDISLPATAVNNEIFGYANVEEVQSKFKVYDDARLYIDGILILDGKFRMNQITRDAYSGNLGVPAAKTVKDIFGETKMNEAGSYPIMFKDFTEWINYWNNEAKEGKLPPCIFPYVLYGLLPKAPSATDDSAYSNRESWDSSTYIRMQDLPPSVNALKILSHIFDSKKYQLTGTAFSDPRINSLYLSYKNEDTYVQPWNYGYQAKMTLKGRWLNLISLGSNEESWDGPLRFEQNREKVSYEGGTAYNSDLLNATNTTIDREKTIDPGANIIFKETRDANAQEWKQSYMRIPSSGYYKIKLNANLKIDGVNKKRYGDRYSDFQILSGETPKDNNYLNNRRYEVKVLRDRGTGDFGLSNGRVDKAYYKNNLSQNTQWEEGYLPKYFPTLGRTLDGKNSEIMLVDPAQNPNYVAGLCWGNNKELNPLSKAGSGTSYGTVLAAKTGTSWNSSANPTKIPKVGIPSPGYARYGAMSIGSEDEDDIPTMDFSSGNWIKSYKMLDRDGNIVDPQVYTNTSTVILYRFFLPNKCKLKLTIPPDPRYVARVFIHNTTDSVKPSDTYTFNKDGVIELDTINSSSHTDFRYLTMYLTYYKESAEEINFDVSKTPKYMTKD